MKVINTISQDIKVVIKGTKYFLPADGSISNVPEAHALRWKTHIHHFIIIEKDTVEDEKSPAAEKQKEVEVKSEPKELLSLRGRYEKLFGKKASDRMKDETVAAKVDEAEKEASKEEDLKEE